jgi:hypothetical protein
MLKNINETFRKREGERERGDKALSLMKILLPKAEINVYDIKVQGNF